MRIRESYTVFPRRMPGTGNVIFYYQCYNEQGERINPRSTGQSKRTLAREFCNALLKSGKLIPAPVPGGRVPTFEKFAQGWWDYETCPYLRSVKGRRPITKAYARQGKMCVEKHLNPVFGKKRLDLITEDMIDTWLTSYEDRKIKRNTANTAFKILSIMLKWAVGKKIIRYNPCANVKKLTVIDEKKVDIFTPDEVRKLFPADWSQVWDNEMYYMINKLAACTGMRIGELLGLKCECIHDTYIDVLGQYTTQGYTLPKGHKTRTIPIPKKISAELGEHMKAVNFKGYVFSRDGGVTPVSRTCVINAFKKAITVLGLDNEARKQRGLSMHAWRHFFNTTLVMANVSDKKIREVTGHSADAMTRHYTHLDTTRFEEVLSVQQGLLTTDTDAGTGTGDTENTRNVTDDDSMKD